MLGKRCLWACVAIGVAGWGCTDSKLGSEGVEGREAVEEAGKDGDKISEIQHVEDRRVGLQRFTLEDKSVWGRDDALYVQINKIEKSSEEEEEEDGEGEEEEIDWEKSEVFVGENKQHRARRAACPEGLSARPGSECFKIELSELPDLPHGEYELELTTALVNKAGKRRTGKGSSPVGISRKWDQSWRLQGVHSDWYSNVATRKGFLVFPTGGNLKAINAQGQEWWATRLPNYATGDFLMVGRHHDTDVLLVNCWLEGTVGKRGIQAFNADTGDILSACENPQKDHSNWALLQGGPGKDLVVVREIQEGADLLLEACRLLSNESDLWDFSCEYSKPWPYTAYATDISVRQISESVARVYAGSLSNYWCATDWSNDNGWEEVCGTQGPLVTGGATPIRRFWGAEHVWVYYNFNDGMGEWWWGFKSDTSAFLGEPVLMDKHMYLQLVDFGDQLIAPGADGIRRYSADGRLLASREDSTTYAPYFALMEGGMVVYPNSEGNLACLKPDLKSCWSKMNVVGSMNYGALKAILPVSSTRSLVIVGHNGDTIGILVDSPGLKKDAPWPMYGRDLCHSYNVSVPADNCWDGPRPPS